MKLEDLLIKSLDSLEVGNGIEITVAGQFHIQVS